MTVTTFVFSIFQWVAPDYHSTMATEGSIIVSERFKAGWSVRVADSDYNASKTCLSRILLNETSGESKLGSIHVAQVVMNRVNDGRFPDTVCENLQLRGAFSFYNPKSEPTGKVRRYPQYYTDIAENALQGKYKGVTSALYFKRCDKKSSFFTKLKKVRRVGQHCFYNERG